MIVAIGALHREYGLRELVVASYQAASGAGQDRRRHAARPAQPRWPATGRSARAPGNVRQAVGDDLGPFPAPLALNVVPWAGSLATTAGRPRSSSSATSPARSSACPT
jgi:aspartate-semialdehyde dehydrogenase